MDTNPPSTSDAILVNVDIQAAKDAVHTLCVRHQRRIPESDRFVFGNLQNRLYERISDLRTILIRLDTCGAKLNCVFGQVRSEYPSGVPIGQQPDPGYVEGMDRVRALTDELKLDMESLVLFGSMLLDDWSRTVALAQRLSSGASCQLEILLNTLQGWNCPDALTRLRDEQGTAAVYLWLTVRVYRNQMVAHDEQPWIRGRTFVEATPSFMLARTLPRQILDLEAAAADVEAMRTRFGLPAITPENPWDVLTALSNRVDLIRTQADREHIARHAAKYGAISPSYQILGRRLVQFIIDASALA